MKLLAGQNPTRKLSPKKPSKTTQTTPKRSVRVAEHGKQCAGQRRSKKAGAERLELLKPSLLHMATSDHLEWLWKQLQNRSKKELMGWLDGFRPREGGVSREEGGLFGEGF